MRILNQHKTYLPDCRHSLPRLAEPKSKLSAVFMKAKPPYPTERDDAILQLRLQSAAFVGLTFPSRTVRLVENSKNRSPRLPTSCDACHKTIGEYPFIAKHHRSYRKYHVACALRIALILPTVGKV